MPTLTVNLAYDAPGSSVSTSPSQRVTVQALTDVVDEVGGVTYIVGGGCHEAHRHRLEGGWLGVGVAPRGARIARPRDRLYDRMTG